MGSVRQYYVQNFGCRAAQADGAALGSRLAYDGHTEASERGEADLVILNTCTVTSSADEEVRQTVRRVRRENPSAEILLTGCYAQRAPEELRALPGVRWVVGNSHKTEIPEIVRKASRLQVDFHGELYVSDIAAQREFLSAPVLDSAADRTRPNLKVQDGCDNRCSFCVIPSVRGPSRSASAVDVVAQVKGLASRYREVVLSGINLGRWGRDASKPRNHRLVDLVRQLLDETPVERLRLSSVEPMDYSDELLDLMASAGGRMAAHVHAPLQSGCDATLKRMKRRYRARHYAQRIGKAFAALPEAAFGADVMVGFPGETNAEFDESARFIEGMPFTYLHVFTYSERPGTPAAGYEGQVPMAVRKERNRILRELAARKNLAFRHRFVGRTLSAVTLEGGRALSSNYIQLELAHAGRTPNRLVDVAIGGVAATGLRERVLLPVLA
jgi:threonylcarbamoyladenosine tRNA methylthiotransferase MtaB